MGEARRRGTFEQRAAEAAIREAELEKKRQELRAKMPARKFNTNTALLCMLATQAYGPRKA